MHSHRRYKRHACSGNLSHLCCRRRRCGSSRAELLLVGDKRDAVGFEALLALDHLDPDPLARLERIQLAAPQRRDVNKDVLAAAVGRDEAVALLMPEPFDRSLERLRRARGRRSNPSSDRRARCDGGTRVDAEDIGDKRPLRPGADLAGDRGTLADIVIAGAAQGRHRQERVLRAVGHRDKAEPFAGVEPFDRRIDAAAGSGGHFFLEDARAAVVHGASKRSDRTRRARGTRER